MIASISTLAVRPPTATQTCRRRRRRHPVITFNFTAQNAWTWVKSHSDVVVFAAAFVVAAVSVVTYFQTTVVVNRARDISAFGDLIDAVIAIRFRNPLGK
jgi:hypothetical protein